MELREANNDGEMAMDAARRKLEVLLVYEDLSTGLRARQALEHLAEQLEFDAGFKVDLWRFDLLCEPRLLGHAAAEAAKSDLVILSAHGQRELPRAASLWLERWFERRSGQPCGLVILLDPLPGGTLGSHQPWEALRAAALAAGIDVFLYPAEALPAERRAALEEIRFNSESLVVTPAELLRGFEPQPYRHWGINE